MSVLDVHEEIHVRPTRPDSPLPKMRNLKLKATGQVESTPADRLRQLVEVEEAPKTRKPPKPARSTRVHKRPERGFD